MPGPLAIPILDGVLAIAGKVIARVWPDPAQQAEAARKLVELQQAGELSFLNADLAVLTGQLEINKMEAQHGGVWKGGWRPFVGWGCGFAFIYKFIIKDLLVSGVQIIAFYTDAEVFPIDLLPEINWMEISVVLMGMLGIGTLRTYEKRKTAG